MHGTNEFIKEQRELLQAEYDLARFRSERELQTLQTHVAKFTLYSFGGAVALLFLYFALWLVHNPPRSNAETVCTSEVMSNG